MSKGEQVSSPKVSVILTSFNHGKYINEAIDSILNQTFTDFELVVWDDASSDNSWEIVCSYDDVRIKAHRNDRNMSGGNINRALEVVLGEYIAIHHSDDVWELDKLEKQVAYLDEYAGTGAVFTWVQFINEHGAKFEGGWFDQENKSQWQWLNLLFNEQNNFNHPSVLIRKKCYQEVGGYRVYLAQTPDAEMWSRLLIKYPIHIIQEKLTKHRLFSNQSNTSGNRVDVAIRASNEWNVLRKNFLTLASFECFVAVFPSLEKFRRNAGFNPKFLFAMACLYECNQRSAWQLGLTCLFDLLTDKDHAQEVKDLYDFSYADLIKLTAVFDVYAIEFVGKQAKIIAEQELKIAEQELKIAEQELKLNSIYASRSWKVTRPLRFLTQVIRNN